MTTKPAKRIPIRAARGIAEEFGQRQVILVTWDGAATHVVTFGTSLDDCDQAAQGGNRVKFALGWPGSLLHAEPSRVRALRRRVAELERELALARTAAPVPARGDGAR